MAQFIARIRKIHKSTLAHQQVGQCFASLRGSKAMSCWACTPSEQCWGCSM